MPILGAHQSIAGGYYKAVEIARRTGCDCVQVFTKNNNQWRAKPITPEEAQRVSRRRSKTLRRRASAVARFVSHQSRQPRRRAVEEVDRRVRRRTAAGRAAWHSLRRHASRAATRRAREARGLKRIIRALDEVHRQTKGIAAKCLLENTAGQGSNLGWRFEHLAAILDGVRDPERLGGVCIDTCHLFAAGYAMATEKEFKATMRELDKVVGLERVKAFHLNDSKAKFGSRVDRHAHIGRGEIGLEAFRVLVNDRRFRRTPMYLETPKGVEDGRDLDEINLEVLARTRSR